MLKTNPEKTGRIEKRSVQSTPPSVRAKTVGETAQLFEEIEQQCQKYLYWHTAKENISLTNELKLRIPLQAEKSANFIFHAHTLKGTEPTEKETQLYLLRAKYELDRIPAISKKITATWKKEGHFNEQKDPLLIRMIAERQASIEGRLYLEAKQEGHTLPSYIARLAEKELQAHREQTKDLTSKLVEFHALTDSAATHCARDILRHKETHGTKPTDSQIETMIQISKELEKRDYVHSQTNHGNHEAEFLRRRDGDLMFRQMCSQDKSFIPLEHKVIQTQASIALENISTQVAKDLSRAYQREISM